jgi:nickel-type superoxide dismutase maturation protease
VKPRNTGRRRAVRLIAAAVIGAACAVLARLARRVTTEAVAGDSMRPTLVPGDWLVVRRGARVRTGDIVVARRPDRTDLRVVKRVTGHDGGGWWLEGDNPAASHDSWVFGAVPGALIEGRAVARYWPSPTMLARRRAR